VIAAAEVPSASTVLGPRLTVELSGLTGLVGGGQVGFCVPPTRIWRLVTTVSAVNDRQVAPPVVCSPAAWPATLRVITPEEHEPGKLMLKVLV
jgi:hypothetical protein